MRELVSYGGIGVRGTEEPQYLVMKEDKGLSSETLGRKVHK